jgi:hypothetical protein
VQNIEEHPAGGGVGAVIVRIGAEHRMYRADRHGVSALGGHLPDEDFQGSGIAQSTVARAAKRVELGGYAPDARPRLAGQLGYAGAGLGCNRQGHAASAYFELVITDGIDPRQPTIGIQFAGQSAAIFHLESIRTAGLEACQKQWFVLLMNAQGLLAGRCLFCLDQSDRPFDGLLVPSGIAQPFQQVAQGLFGHRLGFAEGVHPVDIYPGGVGQPGQCRISHQLFSSRAIRLLGGSMSPRVVTWQL